MKKLSPILLALIMLGAGCLSSSVPSTTSDTSALWAVSNVSENKLTYRPIDWYSGEVAVEEAKKDGCESACAPGGFYWRYQNDEDVSGIWTLGDTSEITVKLICNTETCTPDNPSENQLETMSFSDYVTASAKCRTSPIECPYYSLGTGMDFFDITFAGGSIQAITQHYVP